MSAEDRQAVLRPAVTGRDRMMYMADPAPPVGARHPADVVTSMIERVLEPAQTWPRWDGTPFKVPVEGEPPRT